MTTPESTLKNQVLEDSSDVVIEKDKDLLSDKKEEVEIPDIKQEASVEARANLDRLLPDEETNEDVANLHLEKVFVDFREKEENREASVEARANLDRFFPDKEKPNVPVTRQEIAESNRLDKKKATEVVEPKAPTKKRTLADIATTVVKDIIGGGLVRGPAEVALGAAQGVNEMLRFVDEIGTSLNELTGLPQTETKIKIPEAVTEFLKPPKGAETVTGQVIRAISQFSVGLKGVNVALKAFKVPAAAGAFSKFFEAVGKFVAGDIVAFPEHEKRLADILDEVPALKGVTTKFLKSDPDDSFALGKFKQAVEGTLIGAAAEPLVASVKAFKSLRTLKKQAKKIKKYKVQLAEEAFEKKILEEESKIIGESTRILGDPESKKLLLSERLEKSFKETEGLIKEPVEGLVDPTVKNIADSINMHNLETEADVLKLFDEVATFTKGKKITKSLKETIEKSEGLDGVKTLFKNRKGQPWNEDQVAAAKLAASAIYRKFIEVSKIAANPNALAPDVYNARKMLAITNLTFESIEGGKRASGLSLGAWRIKGEDAKTFKQMQSILDSTGGFPANQDLFKKIAANIEGLSKEQMRTIVQKGPFARTFDGLIDAWKFGMLSSPRVQIKNFASTMIAALKEIPKSFLAYLPKDSPVVKEESLYMIIGMATSLKEAFSKGAAAFRDPSARRRALQKWDLPEQIASSREALDASGVFIPFAYGLEAVGRVNRAIALNPMVFVDEFSRGVLEKMKVFAIAARDGVNKGLKGKELYNYVGEYAKNPSSADITKMNDFAELSLFFTKLGKTGRAAQAVISRNPVLKIPFPFIRTQANVAKYLFEHSVLAPTSKRIRSNIAKGGVERAESLAKIGIGAATTNIFADLTLNGDITGSAPKDRRERELLLSTGWRPNSIRWNGKYVSYKFLGQLGTAMGWAADMATYLFNYDAYDSAAQDEVDKLSTAMTLTLSNNAFDPTFLGNLTKTLAAIQDPLGPDGKSYGRSLAASLIPGFIAKAAQVLSPEARLVESSFDAIKSRLPFARDGLPIRRDVFGRPMKTYYPSFDGMKGIPYVGKAVSTVSAYFNPLYQSDAQDPRLAEYLIKNGFPISYPSKQQQFEGTMIDLRENPELYSRLLELRGSIRLDENGGLNLEEYLLYLISRKTDESEDFFDDMKHSDQINFMQLAVNDYQNAAKDQMMEESPIIEFLINESLQNERKAALPLGE